MEVIHVVIKSREGGGGGGGGGQLWVVNDDFKKYRLLHTIVVRTALLFVLVVHMCLAFVLHVRKAFTGQLFHIRL